MPDGGIVAAVVEDYRSRMAVALQPFLRPGEDVRFAAPLIKDPGSVEDVPVRDELKNLFDPTILLGLGSHPGAFLQRFLFGRAVRGPAGSLARTLFEQVAAAGVALAITEIRLLLYRAEQLSPTAGDGPSRGVLGGPEYHARPLYEMDRRQIVGAVAAPRGVLRRGRFLLFCVDGSAAALVCARPSDGARAVAELGPPPADVERVR